MPISQDLLNKISEYEKQGETPDRIVRGLAQSKNYPDVASKLQDYLSQNEKPDYSGVLQKLKSSSVTEIPKSFIDFISRSVPKNVVDVGKGLYQTVRHPFETAKNIGGLAGTVGRAGMEKLTGEEIDPEARAALEATGIPESIRNPKGIPQRAWNYLYNKPVDVAMMVSPTLGAFGKGAELAGLPRVGNVLTKAAEWTNPITAPTKAISPATKALKRVGKETVGALTGGGPGFVEEAAKGSEMFQKAMRGQISGEEIVETAKDALGRMSENRGRNYRARLENIKDINDDLDISRIKNKSNALKEEYGIKDLITQETKTVDTGILGPKGEKITRPEITSKKTTDYTRTAVGKRGTRDLRETIKIIDDWGSKPGDRTALGLDTLKKQLDDFYSDSSKARAFVASMRNEVKKTIVENVPEYSEMTKGYEEATRLIKDIESNLMLRKEGMSGRITADQTLRRLSSALRENFEMRKDLMDILGTQGAKDVSGMVAGHVASQVIPRGLIGKWGAGGEAYIVYLHPKMWPILAASSPRVVGEFLNAYGWAMKKAGRIPEKVGRAAKFATSPTGVTPIYGASKVNQFREETHPRNALTGE